jgi:membrane-bound lytic murein transglycosylase F
MGKKISFISFILLIILSGCNKKQIPVEVSHDLDEIVNRGKLIALTNYNSTSYFIYRGAPMGYQYELLKNLADSLDLDLELNVSNNLDSAFNDLEEFKCDILASNLTITSKRQERFTFTEPIGQTQTVIVQLSIEKWKKLFPNDSIHILIRDTLEMGGRTFHVVKSSVFTECLQKIEKSTGDTIQIAEMDNIDTEQLIGMVSRGEIEYCIADLEIALINKTYYPYLDITTVISAPQNQAWAVNKNNPLLLQKVNEWIRKMNGTALQAVIYNRYFNDTKTLAKAQSPYQSFKGGQISPYDAAIKKQSKHIRWDWRLLASLIYQESHFDPKVKSWAGAFGLMQLMPETAAHFGVNNQSSPESQIKAGVKFIKWLNKQLKDSITDDQERIKFILASYNVGLGHIHDARRLARKYGKDPNIWDGNVDFFLLHKSDPKYYDRFLVKSGYCRGEETCSFVKEVMERFRIYTTLLP